MNHLLTARAPRLVAVLALAVVLAGCTATTPEPQVATLAAPGPTSADQAAHPSVSPPAEDAPARERLDMTDEELQALMVPMTNCLAAQGIAGKPVPGADPVTAVSPPVDYDTAMAACQHLAPLPPWEYDRTNPDSRNFAQAIVDCLHTKGVKYADIVDDATSPTIDVSLGGPNNDSDSITRGMDLMPQCEREASAAH